MLKYLFSLFLQYATSGAWALFVFWLAQCNGQSDMWSAFFSGCGFMFVAMMIDEII
jgi:hypothetical protein